MKKILLSKKMNYMNEWAFLKNQQNSPLTLGTLFFVLFF